MQIGTVQFPWRFISIVNVLIMFALVFVLDHLIQDQQALLRTISIVMVVAIALTTFIYYQKVIGLRSIRRIDYVRSDEILDYLYLPSEVHDRFNAVVSQVEIASGDVEVIKYKRKKGDTIISLNDTDIKDSEIIIPIYKYKYFYIFDDEGNRLEQYGNEKGTISCIIPGGYQGDITVRFCVPAFWRVAEIISLFFIVFLWYYHVKVRKRETLL